MKKRLFKYFMVLISISTMQACISLKPYERVYVNDPEMLMGVDAAKKFANYVYSIREGAIPAGASKASGGCGCN